MPKRNTPNQPYGPEPGRTTAPMPHSPYPSRGGYVPPPPPPPGYTSPAPIPPAPATNGGIPAIHPQPPRAGPQRNRGGSFAGGIVAAIIMVALVGIGFAALSGNLGGKGNVAAHGGSTPVAGVATTVPGTTPAPTLAPTFTPTEVPPTVAPSPNPHTLPPPPAGFINFLPQGENWGLNYRIGTQVHSQAGALPVNGQNVTAIIFDLGHNATFTVYDLAQPIPADQSQSLFDAVAKALNAQDVQVLDQTPTQIGANAWAALHLRATINGQRYEGYCLYAPHGTGANAVSMIAPVGATFTTINASDFQPMIDSFTYLS